MEYFVYELGRRHAPKLAGSNGVVKNAASHSRPVRTISWPSTGNAVTSLPDQGLASAPRGEMLSARRAFEVPVQTPTL